MDFLPNPEQIMAKERTIGDVIDRELDSLRVEQAKKVMPMIGPLLDAWDGLPNDVVMMPELKELRAQIRNITRAIDE